MPNPCKNIVSQRHCPTEGLLCHCMAGITQLQVQPAPTLDSSGVFWRMCQAEPVPHRTHKLCTSQLQMSRHQDHIQPKRSSAASAAAEAGQALQLLSTLSAQRVYKRRVSPLIHKTYVHVLDTWQEFINASCQWFPALPLARAKTQTGLSTGGLPLVSSLPAANFGCCHFGAHLLPF